VGGVPIPTLAVYIMLVLVTPTLVFPPGVKGLCFKRLLESGTEVEELRTAIGLAANTMTGATKVTRNMVRFGKEGKCGTGSSGGVRSGIRAEWGYNIGRADLKSDLNCIEL
jgi:hypothetical protein